MKQKKYEINMIEGSIFGKLLLFALPLIFSSILQLLFNAADVIVVGRYAGSEALAAVGSTGSLVNLLTNLFMGLSVGANVLFARYIGSKQEKQASEVLHTSVLLSILSGILLTIAGILFAGPLLRMMSTPEDVISLSSLYLKIYFLGMPAMLFFNFGSALLRAVGDTRRPLIFLAISGVINVILNLIFVIPLQMSVAGVALATILSQLLSAIMLLICLIKTNGPCQLIFKELRLNPVHTKKIISIGLPAGLQGGIFSLSNVLIQSSINSFGFVAMAGNSAAANIEGFVYVSMNAFHQTAISFVSQNYGARKYDRILKITVQCLFLSTFVGLLLGNLAYYFGSELLSLYNGDKAVIEYGLVRMKYICVPYFLCGIMDVMVGAMRGLGYSILPMIVSLIGACAFRILWIMTIFQYFHSLSCLFISYPVSWSLTFTAHCICFFMIRKKLKIQ